MVVRRSSDGGQMVVRRSSAPVSSSFILFVAVVLGFDAPGLGTPKLLEAARILVLLQSMTFNLALFAATFTCQSRYNIITSHNIRLYNMIRYIHQSMCSIIN
jgi:hypothetical protein